MMKTYHYLLCAVMICWAIPRGSVGQMQCSPVSFTGTSFEKINFRPYHVIHNSEAQRTMYTSLVDGSVRLFDDSREELYERYNNGSCLEYHNTRGQDHPAPPVQLPEERFKYTDLGDTEFVGYNMSLNGGFFKAKLLLSLDQCYIHYVWVNSGGKQLLANYNTEHRQITEADRQEIEDVLAVFHADDCAIVTL